MGRDLPARGNPDRRGPRCHADQIGVIAVMVQIAGLDLPAVDVDLPVIDRLHRIRQGPQTQLLQREIHWHIIGIAGGMVDRQLHQWLNL